MLSTSPDYALEFNTMLESFLHTYLSKGFPGLFACIKPMLKSNSQHSDLANSFLIKRLNELEKGDASDVTLKQEMSWILYFLAQQSDMLNPGNDVSIVSLFQLRSSFQQHCYIYIYIRMMNKHIDLFSMN